MEDLQVLPTASKSIYKTKPRAVLRMPRIGGTAIGKAVIKSVLKGSDHFILIQQEEYKRTKPLEQIRVLVHCSECIAVIHKGNDKVIVSGKA